MLMLKPAIPADVDILSRMNQQLREDQGSQPPATLEQLEERARGWFAQGRHVTIFVEAGEALGYAVWADEDDGVFLHAFFTARHRRRTGLGRQALDLLLNGPWAGKTNVRLDVLLTNPRGHAFWKAMGFTDRAMAMERKL